MLIDWFTVGAQVVNFLVLIWLMKRFLYKPIITALDQREKLIATQIADAKQKQDDAKKQSDEFNKKNQDFDRDRTALLAKATADADNERLRLIEVAKTAAAETLVKQQATIKKDELRLHDSIRAKTKHEVFAVAQKALTDLSGNDLEDRIVDVFLGRLQTLSLDEKSHVASLLKVEKKPIVITTSFDRSSIQKAKIESAVKNLLGKERDVEFTTAPALICGIEMKSNGQKVSWSIADFLTSLEQSVPV